MKIRIIAMKMKTFEERSRGEMQVVREKQERSIKM